MPMLFHLKIPNITGESEIKDYADQIQVLSFSWGASNAADTFGAGGSHGGSSVHRFSFTKYVDSGTPKLFACCAAGKHIDQVVLSGDRSGTGGGRENVLKYVFTDVIISDLSWSAGSDRPTEAVSFAFAKIELQYFSIVNGKKADQVMGSFDILKNMAQ